MAIWQLRFENNVRTQHFVLCKFGVTRARCPHSGIKVFAMMSFAAKPSFNVMFRVPLGCCSSHGATCCESNSATWRDMARASTTKHNSGCYKAQTAGNFLSLQIPCQCYCRHIRLQLYYDQYTTTTTTIVLLLPLLTLLTTYRESREPLDLEGSLAYSLA